MKTNLATFRHSTRRFVAKLDGLKHIMRVETPRTSAWYLVLPASGDEDSVCVLLKKIGVRKYYKHAETARVESLLLKEYADRIIAEA